MKKLRLSTDGFSLIEVSIVIVVLVLLGGVGWYIYYQEHKKTASTTTSSLSSTIEGQNSSKPLWIIGDTELAALIQYENANDPGKGLVQHIFDSPNTYVNYGNAPNVSLPKWDFKRMARLSSFSAVQAWLKNPMGVSAIMYDIEPNTEPPTPVAEQQNPVSYYQQASTLVHAAGIQFWGTHGESTSDANLLAPYCDAFDWQSQRGEADVSSFKSAIASSTAVARQAKADVAIFAGVTTQVLAQGSATQGGQTFTAQQMAAATEAIYPSTVNGIWLNDPKSHPDITYAYLQLLDQAGW